MLCCEHELHLEDDPQVAGANLERCVCETRALTIGPAQKGVKNALQGDAISSIANEQAKTRILVITLMMKTAVLSRYCRSISLSMENGCFFDCEDFAKFPRVII